MYTDSRGPSSRLVLENLLNLLHDVVGELGQQLQRLAVVVHLLWLGCSEDYRADVFAAPPLASISTWDGNHKYSLLRAPCQRELCRVATQLLGNLAEFPHLLQLRLPLLRLELFDGALEEFGVCGEPRVFWDALVVLACQDARVERAPDGRAHLVVLEERGILLLEPLTVEGVVLRLLHHGRNQVVLFGNVVCLLDAFGRPLGRTPVIGEVQLDGLCEGLDNLLHRNPALRQ